MYYISLDSSWNKKKCFKVEEKIITQNFMFQNISHDPSAICADLSETARKDDSFRSSIIAGDETRCLQYDRPKKRQIEGPRDKNSPASKKPLALPTKTKTTMIAFFRLQRCSAQEICSIGSNCKPRCLKKCTATFRRQHSTSVPWVVSNRDVVPPKRQCAAAYVITRQRIFVSTWNHSTATCAIFSRFVTLRFFFYSQDWNEHWKAVAMLTFRQFRRPWQNRSEAYHKVLSRTASETSRNAGSSALMKEEVISQEFLSIRL
jgi:hypothetical protein